MLHVTVGCPAPLARRQLTPGPISSSPETARSPPSISSLTRCRDLDAAAVTSITAPQPAAPPRNRVISRCSWQAKCPLWVNRVDSAPSQYGLLYPDRDRCADTADRRLRAKS